MAPNIQRVMETKWINCIVKKKRWWSRFLIAQITKKKDDGYSSFRTFQIQNISELQSEIEPPPF